MKVTVGVSGGVDSAVTAYLLKQQGFDVNGAVLKMHDGEGFNNLYRDALAVCESLHIPLFCVDMRNMFKSNVTEPFKDAYMNGKTPNPCVFCNVSVKWEGLLKTALETGADYVATGHYVKKRRIDNRETLEIAEDLRKDQSYMLYRLTQEQLSKTIFPCGDLTKESIRKIAREANIPVAEKSDSQEICFIPDDDYIRYLTEQCGHLGKAGRFIDESGAVLGTHDGIAQFTIGQRKGFKMGFGRRVYVKGINSVTGDVTLCDNDALYSNGLIAEQINFMGISEEELINAGELECDVKIRYGAKPAKCAIIYQNNTISATFHEPNRAVTKGQSAVFYKNGLILCGGVII